MVVNGIPVHYGLNEIIISQNIADLLRTRLCNNSMHLIKIKDNLSNALKEKYEYENMVIDMAQELLLKDKSIKILKNEIKIQQRSSRTQDPRQAIKLKRSASF